MKSFKSWILNELSGRNAYNRMVMQHPSYQGMPKQVRDEFVNSSFGSTINNSSNRSSVNKPNQAVQPSEFLNNSPYKDRQWQQQWLKVTPMNFTDESLNLLIQRCFGYRPLPTIRNDMERTATQKDMYDDNSQKPVILFQVGDKFKLQEGWHRTMNILLWERDPNRGAPNEQINLLKMYANQMMQIDNQFHQNNGLDNNQKIQWIYAIQPLVQQLKSKLNFSSWNPVPLHAFVGQASNNVQPTTDPRYLGSTADMNDIKS